MTDAAKETLFSIIERWGFPTLVAIAFGWVLRQDVLLPLVESHQKFVGEMAATQHDIARSIQEQTRLLYVIRDGREKMYTTSVIDPDDTPKN